MVHRGAFFAELKTTTVRKLLPESWGYLCPVVRNSMYELDVRQTLISNSTLSSIPRTAALAGKQTFKCELHVRHTLTSYNYL